MIIDFTEEELRTLKALEDGYEKLLKDLEEKILELRPKDPEPDEEAYRRLQESRPKPPAPPKPIDVRDGTPVYSKEEYDAYTASPEYQAYAAENKRINDAVGKLWDDWYNAGSKAWKTARKKYEKLEQEYVQARNDLIQKAEDRQFSALGDDPTAILEDAYRQAERLVFNRYNYYDHMRSGGSFSARDVRLQDDGNFRLDTVETRRIILGALERHIKALPEDLVEELYEFIDRTLATNPFVSDTGELGALVEIQETTEKRAAETGLTVNRPKNYKYPNTKVNTRLFGNELTTEDRNYFTPLGLNSKKTVITYANFVMPSTAVSAPKLDDYDERVYAAVGSCLFAGNNFIPFSTLYNRGMLGLSPREKNRAVTADIKKDIIEALEKFIGQVTIDNDPTGELEKADPDFKREVIRESLLFYQIREERVHGQVTEGVAIPTGYVPVLYRYAESNRNEVITDRIESIHVAGLNYTRQNITIASATYKRVKEIQYHNDQKSYKREIPENKRTIRYDSIAEKAGLDFSGMTPTERNRLKKKIDSCMKSYQESGLFDHYEHKRDNTKTFYAVVLYFDPAPKKLK